MADSTMGTGTWTPLDRVVIHFGSPAGATYAEPDEEKS